MKNILHTYKLRLTNISQANRALRLLKLSSRRDIDLTTLGFVETDTAEQLLQKIIAGKKCPLITKLDPRWERLNLADKQLNLLYREVENIRAETGTHDLYIGYPFVEGKFADGTTVRCPVLLFPVELQRSLTGKPRWALSLGNETEIMWNTTFFLAYELYQKQRIAKEFWEERIEYNEDWNVFLNGIYQILKKYDIEVNFNAKLFENKIETFFPFNKEVMDNFPVGKLTFQSQAVMGIFPQSDSALMQDYETLSQNPDDFEMARLFEKQAFFSDSHNQTFSENEALKLYLTDIDGSQEAVLEKVKQGKSLVVYGPPGTGKSQVIVNMIASAIGDGKTVLVVSQKRAALDVVFKRLVATGFGAYAALLHDQQSDRVALFEKIRKHIESMADFQKNVHKYEQEPLSTGFDALAQQLNQHNGYFEALFQALTVAHPCGLSPYQLYILFDPQCPLLPIEDIAYKLNNTSIEVFSKKILRVMDYAEYFSTSYAWADRIPFHAYTYDDKFTILNKIQDLYTQIKTIQDYYFPLTKSLGSEDILAVAPNQIALTYYKKIVSFLSNPPIAQAVAAIEYEGVGYAEWIFRQAEWAKQLREVEKLTVLKGNTWDAIIGLFDSVKIYEHKKSELLRVFSGEYKQAVQYIEGFFHRKNMTWNETTYYALQNEIHLFYNFTNFVKENNKNSFYQDFPTNNIWEYGQKWIVQKNEQIEAWNFIRQNPHFPSIKPRYIENRLDTHQWNASLSTLEDLQKLTDVWQAFETQWQQFLAHTQIEKLKACIKNQDIQYVDVLKNTFTEDFEELKQLDLFLQSFSPTEKSCFQPIRPFLEHAKIDFKASENKDSFILAFKNSLYSAWIQQAEREKPILTEVSTRGFHQKITDFSDLYLQKRTEGARYLQYLLQKKICDTHGGDAKTTAALRDLHHQVSKKRRLWTVRKLVQEMWAEGLSTFLPCWLASPESVSAIFPMKSDFFDVVIFDEASQCFVERALPVMLRGKQIVVAGDNKQLQPFDMYNVRYEEGEFVEDETALEVESVLDLARTRWEQAHLQWHYRSQESDLIQFSNLIFYENLLQMIPTAQADASYHPPLEWLSVEGLWKNNRNEPEAQYVVELIIQLIQRPDKPSIGVVTFNYFQQELIKDLLDETLERLATENPDLYALLQESFQKTENEEFMGLFVKNIENVQGDERDIIIFSVGYAVNTSGKLNANFGSLNLQGGEFRLNVAITRARKKIYVACSFSPTMLEVENSKHLGPKLLKRYLQYVKAVSEGREPEINPLLQTGGTQDSLHEENPIADFLAEKLQASGYFVERNYGDSRYKIDIAVKKQASDRNFLLAIECEGGNYFSGASAKEREIYRRNLLLQRGWKWHRVSARNYAYNREKEWEKIKAML